MNIQLLAYEKYKDVRTSIQAGIGGIRGLGYTTSEANSAGCPMLPDGSCNYGGMNISCGLVRECDPYTGNVHFEYALPGGSNNVDIASFDLNTGTLDLTKTTQQQASYYSSQPTVNAINQYQVTGQIPTTNSAQAGATATTANPSNTSSNGGSNGTSTAANTIGTNTTIPVPTDLLSSTLSIFGVNVPVWALGVAGLGVVVMLFKK